jgi:hypothetical protein
MNIKIESNRLDVLKALTSHLQGIASANGYEIDLSDAIRRGRTLFGEGDPIPLVSILESPRSDPGRFAGENFAERSEKWSLLIQGWVVDDPSNPTDPAYILMATVEHRLARIIAVNRSTGEPAFPDEYMLGRKVAEFTVMPGVVRPPMEQVSSKAFFYLPVQVALVRENE